jgi:hypothetical protein
VGAYNKSPERCSSPASLRALSPEHELEAINDVDYRYRVAHIIWLGTSPGVYCGMDGPGCRPIDAMAGTDHLADVRETISKLYNGIHPHETAHVLYDVYLETGQRFSVNQIRDAHLALRAALS